MDAVEYLDPETINGFNLYAYCCSDPVNKIDPTGHAFFSLLLAAAITGVVSGIANIAGQMIAEDKSIKKIDWKKVGISAVSGFVSGFIPAVDLWQV